MAGVSPGIVGGLPMVRDHTVKVRIDCTDHDYHVNYVDSINMKAGNGRIHRKHASWVRNLEHDIDALLAYENAR